MFKTFLAIHASSWAILIVLLIAAAMLYSNKVIKVGTIVHMILRLMYVVMLVSGCGMLFLAIDNSGMNSFTWTFLGKAVLAIAMMGVSEMLLIRIKKQKTSLVMWIVDIVLLVAILGIAFSH
ncbi:DUF1516 family protein [Brochothrix campestris]|uniref:DUF1516 family protein n=1 Tax=Brochothrix campestris TaxID=2757 RepID=UPI0038D1FE7B